MPVTTLMRILVGGLFMGHGLQKLFGWFGGSGMEGTAGFFESVGLRPGKPHAVAAGAAETAGGALLAAGVATPAAGAALSGVMTGAIKHVHADNGPWSTDGGWEYNAVLLASVLAIVEERSGPKWALASLGAGVAGSLIASRIGADADATPSPPETVVEVAEQPEKQPETVVEVAEQPGATLDVAEQPEKQPETVVEVAEQPGATAPGARFPA